MTTVGEAGGWLCWPLESPPPPLVELAGKTSEGVGVAVFSSAVVVRGESLRETETALRMWTFLGPPPLLGGGAGASAGR